MSERIAGGTDKGKMRSNNEDCFVTQETPHGLIFGAVIDGVGGYAGGEVAAAIAQVALNDLGPEVRSVDAGLLQRTLVEINQKIHEEKLGGNYPNMSCVVTTVIADETTGTLAFAHVGDTRLYLYRDKTLVKLSKDDSLVGLLEDSGRISEDEAISHPRRNEINKALGFEPAISAEYIEIGDSPFLPGDMLLLCSDGLTDMLKAAEISNILERGDDLQNIINNLISAANDKGGKDNITVVLLKNTAKKILQKNTGSNSEATTKTIHTQERPPVEEYFPERRSLKPSGSKSIYKWLVLMIALLALAVFIWWITSDNKESNTTDPVGAMPTTEDSLGSASDTLILTKEEFGDTVTLVETVWLQQDSLVIIGRGNTVVEGMADSVMLQVAPSVSHLAFSRLELKDLVVQVTAKGQEQVWFDSVRLNKVKFGIGTPVEISDTIYTGRLSDLLKIVER